ncbi:MAG TPA: transcription-repair coupling factor [Ktedonobacterales bacterium]|nr:transcription-repair coupling factor [Ktedonobacterales bacterium]
MRSPVSLRGLLTLLEGRPEPRRLRELLAAQPGAAPAPVIHGVSAPARPYLVAGLARELAAPLLYVTRDDDQVEAATQALSALVGGAFPVRAFPALDALPSERLLPDRDTIKRRMNALILLSGHISGPAIVVCSARALTQPVMPPDEFRAALLELRPGDRAEPQIVLRRLMALGYDFEAEVEEAGALTHRGGIIDVFSPAMERPARIEFFGDEIESIRTFDPETQRSLNQIPAALITPAREALATRGPEAARRLSALDAIGLNPDARARWQADLEALSAGQSFEDIAYYMPYLHEPASILNYLPDGGYLILGDEDAPRAVAETLAEQGEEARDRLEREGENPHGLAPTFLPWAWLEPHIAARPHASFAALLTDEQYSADGLSGALAPDLTSAQSYGGRLRAFAHDVRRLLDSRQRVVIVSLQARRLCEVFGDEALLGRPNVVLVSPQTDLPDAPEPGTLSVVHGRFPEGWHSRTMALTVFTDSEVFGWARHGEQRRRSITPAAFLAELRPGDFVVHQDHGIGRFDGLVKLASGGVEREYLLIAYAGTDKLYIPTDQLDQVTRYIGMGDVAPTLSRLGGVDWARATQRAKESARDIAADLLRLYSMRETIQGHPFPPDEDQPWLREMEEGFPYQETPDQERAIAEVKADMERARPMDRLVCGDVGYGKTEVALRAAFKAMLDQRQVAILAPTTVLALQHFNTFSQRLKPYPVRVELLSRFRSEKEQKETVRDLAAGQVDIVIGTHRLLQKDIVFKNLGLLVIDEEQRFGVAHKERLKQMRAEVDVLTLSATPIPRTLYMALSDVREMSVIETPPQERLPIRTYIREFDDALIREVILREVDRGGQVYFVHNRIKGIQALADRLRRLVPEARFVVGHGQMREDQLEQVMLDFSAGEAQVLICTTIIENGLDIPNANTIIVNNAAYFGLSQLYQLRGRVGRAASQAYAYFLYQKEAKLTPVQEKRLRAIFEATELGAGFRIAMKDLEIRGAGNLLGAEQSGFMNSVGFEMYTRLLAEAIAEMEGKRPETVQRPAPVTLELPVNAYIPDDYINDRSLKMNFYQRMANLERPEQAEALAAELADRFGPPPEPVANLLGVTQLKTEAAALGVEGVSARDGEVTIRLKRTIAPDRVALYKRYKTDARVQLGEVRLPRRRFAEGQTRFLQELRDLLPVIVGSHLPVATASGGAAR